MWVTGNTSEDILGILGGLLTDGKDYKVYKIHDNSYTIRGDHEEETIFGKLWFDKPSTYQPKPKPELIDGSFDNLVLDTDFIRSNKVYVVKREHLTSPQESFMVEKLKQQNLWDSFGDNSSNIRSYVLDENGLVWQYNHVHKNYPVIQFNDLFKEA